MLPTRITTYSNARANFASILDEVVKSSSICIVTRQGKENAAIIAESELSSLLESVYLLRSPANAKVIFDGLNWIKQHGSEAESITLQELKEEILFELDNPAGEQSI